MKIIQLILIPLLVVLTVLYTSRFRSRFLDRLIVLFIGMGGAGMVLFPSATQRLAHTLGVGRGADLIMYLGLLGLAFICFLLFSKIRELELSLTQMARAEAIAHALPAQHKEGLKES